MRQDTVECPQIKAMDFNCLQVHPDFIYINGDFIGWQKTSLLIDGIEYTDFEHVKKAMEQGAFNSDSRITLIIQP